MKKIRDQSVIIGMLEGGELATDLSNALTDTVAKLKAMATVPKKTVKGKVLLAVAIEVEYGGLVSVTADLDTKVPKKARRSSVFWATDDGSLTTEHPQQQDLFNGPREARAAE